MPDLFQDVAFDNQEPHEDVHDENIEKEDFAHCWVESGTLTTHNYRCGVLCAPPANRKKDERNVEKSENAEQGAEEGAAIGLFNQRTEQQVGNIEEPEDEGGGEPGVPGPPDAPDRMGPDGAGNEYDGDTREAHFRAGDAKPIVLLIALPDVQEVCHEADEKDHFTGPRSGRMEVEDALDDAHGALLRSDVEIRVRRRYHQQDSHYAKENAFCHGGLFLQEIFAEKP